MSTTSTQQSQQHEGHSASGCRTAVADLNPAGRRRKGIDLPSGFDVADARHQLVILEPFHFVGEGFADAAVGAFEAPAGGSQQHESLHVLTLGQHQGAAAGEACAWVKLKHSDLL